MQTSQPIINRKVLAPAPSEITISEFVETIANYWKEDPRLNCNAVSIELTHPTFCKDGSCHNLFMWACGRSQKHAKSPDIHLLISNGRIIFNRHYRYSANAEIFTAKLYADRTPITGIDAFNPNDLERTLNRPYH